MSILSIINDNLSLITLNLIKIVVSMSNNGFDATRQMLADIHSWPVVIGRAEPRLTAPLSLKLSSI